MVAGGDDIIKLVSKSANILPMVVRVSLAHQQLLNPRLESVYEVEKEVLGISLGEEGDEALELVGIGLDRGRLAESPQLLARPVRWVGVAQVFDDGISKGFKGLETSVLLLISWGSVRHGVKPGASRASEEA